MTLNTEPHIEKPDEFYKTLANLHDGKTAEESLLINSKLIMLLANHIGDHKILMDALTVVNDQTE